MNEVQLFTYGENKIRTILQNGEPWFIAKDACELLGIGNPSQALKDLEPDERGLISNETHPDLPRYAIVNEFGLNQLIFRSRKPEAKAIKRWLAHDVLPAIRRTGSYSPSGASITSLADLDLNAIGSDILRAWADDREARARAELERDVANEAIEELTPQAEAWQEVVNAEGGWDVALTAQMLANVAPMGPLRLWKRLEEWGWIKEKKRPNDPRRPIQLALERRLIVLKARPPHMRPNGLLHSSPPQILITPKGLDEIAKKLKVDRAGIRLPVLPVEDNGLLPLGEGAPFQPIHLVDRLGG